MDEGLTGILKRIRSNANPIILLRGGDPLGKKATKGLWGVVNNPISLINVLLVAAIIYLTSVVTGVKGVSGPITLLSTTVSRNGNFRPTREQSGNWKTVRMRVTAYCPCQKCCGKHAKGITASGYKIHRADTLVAADKKYPFGTEMIIPGYNNGKPVKVRDRGGAIYGNRLDVLFDSHEKALKWGIRNIDVKIRY